MNEVVARLLTFAVGALVGFLAGVVWISFLNGGGAK